MITLVATPQPLYVLTSSADDTVKLWSIESGACIQTLVHEDAVKSASFSGDGTSVLTASHDRTAKLWSMESGACVQTFVGHGAEVVSAAFSGDGVRVGVSADIAVDNVMVADIAVDAAGAVDGSAVDTADRG